MNRNILPGVPAMGYGNPSAVCFIGSMLRLLDSIADPATQEEAFALSGAGLCFPWQFRSSCDEVGVIPDIPAHAFDAFGYKSEYLYGDDLPDKQTCLEKVKASIDCGRPVIGFGVTVRMPMACLIVGYDENGLYTRAFWAPEGANENEDAYYFSADWFENCAGLLFVGEKTGERLGGAAAYQYILEMALRMQSGPVSVQAEGKTIYLGSYAYDAMITWLLDDAQWVNPGQTEEQFLKQCGLLLMNYYRWQFGEYLKQLEDTTPGTVAPSVFDALGKIAQAVPGAHASDLWLGEAVDPALADFAAMKDRKLREKTADYVQLLKSYDSALLRGLCSEL